MIKSTLQSWVGAWKELKQWVFPASTEVPSGAQRGAFWIDDVPKWYDGTTERNFGIDKLYAGVVMQPTITVNSNIITIGDDGIMRVYDNANYIGLIQEFTPAGSSITIPDSSDVFLCYSIADGYHLRNAQDYTINYSDIITVKRYIYEFGILHESDQDNLALGQSEKQIIRTATTDFYKRVGTYGIELSISTLTANITGGKIYNGPVLQNLDAFVSSADTFSRHTISGSAWSRTAMTAINTSIYNPSTGEAALPTNKWAWAFIYRTVGNSKEAIVRYGDQYFNDKTKAIEGLKLPSSVSLTIRSHSVLVGYICYKSGDTSIPVENVYSAWDSIAISVSGVSEHNALSAIDGGDPAIPYFGHNTQLMQSRQVNAGSANGYVVYDANGNLGEYTQLKPVFGSGQTSKLTASASNSSTAQGWTKLYSWPPAAYNKRHLMLHATSGNRGTLTGVVSVSFMQEATATTISAANITSEHIAGTVSNFSLIYNTASSMIELWYNDTFGGNQQTVFSPIKVIGQTPTAYYGVSQASLPAYSIKFNSINLHVDYLEGLTGNVQTQINDKQPLDSTLTALSGLSSGIPLLTSDSAATSINRATLVESLRANTAISGGGVISVNSTFSVKWSSRFIIIPNGKGSHFSTTGYFDIKIPSSGTVITGLGTTNKTVDANGILLDAWDALYYILPIGSTETTVNANFRLVNYQYVTEIPETWVLLALRNNDTGFVQFPNGACLYAGETKTDHWQKQIDGKLDENANAASATYLDRKYWQGYYVGDTYKYMKIISISTNDINDHTGYESHSIFVGKSFYAEQHHMQGVLNIGMGGTSTSSSPVVSFIGQSRNSKLVYTFDNTNNVLDVYYYISSGSYGGMAQGFVTSIITSTRPSAITLLTGQSQQLSVAGAIDVSYFAVNPINGNTDTNGNLVVGGGSTISGTAHVGKWSGNPNYARVGHKDFDTSGGFGFMQTNDGRVFVEAPNSLAITMRQGGVNKLVVTSTGNTQIVAPTTSDDSDLAVTSAWVKDVAAPINATLTNESGQDVLPTGTYSITTLLQWFRNNLSQLFSSVAGKAPTNHASSSTTYGISTANAFGHSRASGTTPTMNGTGNAGTDNGYYAREGHVHPTDTSKFGYAGGFTSNPKIWKGTHAQYNALGTWDSNTVYLCYT